MCHLACCAGRKKRRRPCFRSKTANLVLTPLSPPDKSKVKRSAKLTLSEDGTLEGDAHVEYYGHLGVYRKEWDDDDSPVQREETLRDAVKKQMSTADVSDIKIENITDPVKPYVYNYHIRVPGYAQRTESVSSCSLSFSSTELSRSSRAARASIQSILTIPGPKKMR